ncbi:MAG: hypothetical protein AB7F76_12860 [Parvibaculaceae bacterium]
MDDIVIVKEFGQGRFDIVGVWDRDRSQAVWILTNAETDPRIKAMPPFGKVRIDRAQFEKIKSNLRMNPEIELFLQNSID